MIPNTMYQKQNGWKVCGSCGTRTYVSRRDTWKASSARCSGCGSRDLREPEKKESK